MLTATYFRVQLEVNLPQKCLSEILTHSQLEANMYLGMKQLFGEIGAAISMEIKHIDAKARTFILAVEKDLAQKLHASLVLQSTFQGIRCAYHVLGQGPSMLSIAQFEPREFLAANA